MYDIIFTWYVTHSSILNLYLRTHYMQQHCCNVLFLFVWICTWSICKYYMHQCAHVSHVRIRRALVSVCFIQIQLGLSLVEANHAWKKTEYRWKNAPRLHPKGKLQNASLKQDQRYTTTQRDHARVSVSCANKRTTTAASSRRKQYQSVVPLLYVRVSYCSCCHCIYVG